MTLSEFRVQYPEFDGTSSAYVSACLTRAGALIDASVWGELYEEAIGLQTASMLVQSPSGLRARPSPALSGAEAPYTRRLEDLRRAVPRRGVVLCRGG